MTEPNVKEIEIDDAKTRLDAGDATFVDIRDPGSYGAAHVPGAVSVGDGNVQDFVDANEKERPLIVYCYHGNSSLMGAAFFQEQGFRDVYSMRGGFEAWRQTLPVES